MTTWLLLALGALLTLLLVVGVAFCRVSAEAEALARRLREQAAQLDREEQAHRQKRAEFARRWADHRARVQSARASREAP